MLALASVKARFAAGLGGVTEEVALMRSCEEIGEENVALDGSS